jgi:energy-coupling factor transporter ATP-binding protein EcfA2
MLTNLASWPDSQLIEKHPHRYHAMNAIAQSLGGFVAAGNLPYEDAANWTLWAMQSNGYLDKHRKQGANYVRNLIRRGLEHGMNTPLPIGNAEIELKQMEHSVKAFTEAYDPQPKLLPKANGLQTQILNSIEDVPDVMELENEPIEWLVPGLVAAGAVTMIVGAAGCGKSSFISAMASHLANGTDFLGLPAFEQKPCLYLDRENSKSFVQSRLRRLHCRCGPNLKYLGGWLGEHLDPDSPIVREWVERQTIAPVIFLDSAVRFIDGNENSTPDVRDFMAKLRWFADRGAAVVFLHHTGKGESTKEGRGAYDFTAASDFVFTMHNAGETILTDITIKSAKQRERGEFASRVHYCNGRFSVDSAVFSHGSADGSTGPLLGYLQSNPDMLKSEFEKQAMLRFGVSQNKIREWLKQAIAAGVVQEIKLAANNAKALRARGVQVAPQQASSVVQ